MSAPQFTPGPWRKCPDEYVVADEGTAIARACSVDSEEVRDANARLIAAAPELYEALEMALDNFGNEGCSCSTCATARAALAKARGEA